MGCSLWGERVTKKYSGTIVLEEATWRFTGRLTLLLAPNGAGKTTLLRLSLGLSRPDRGKAGICVSPRETSWMIDYGGPPQWAPAWRVARFLASLRGHELDEVEARRLFGRIGLPGDTYRKPFGALSSGQKRLVLIATALYGNPEIVVLDEPLSGLDPVMRARISMLINEASKRSRVVVATHVVSLLEGDEVYTIKKHKVIGPRKPPEPLREITIYKPDTGEIVKINVQSFNNDFSVPLGI